MFGLNKKGGSAAAFFLAAAVYGAAPCALAAPTTESDRYVTKAHELEKSGDIPGAIIQLKNAVRENPDSVQARFELGVMYLRTNDPGAAQRELEAARARGYDETKIIQPLVQAYLAQGRFQDILKNFDPAKFSGETQSELMAVQGRAQIALQNYPGAHALLDRAVAQSPNSPAVLAGAAMLARMEQRYEDAEKFVDQGLAKSPDNAELLVLKGEARQQVKDFDGALKALDLAVQKQPRYPRARLARALVNLARNKPDLVPADVREILAIDAKNPLGLYLRAVVLSNEGDYREAVQVLLALPELLDSYPPARYLLAASAFADNQLQSALANAELYLKKVPGDPTGSFLLAATALRLNDYKRAVEILEPLVKTNADNNQLRLQLASAYLGLGRSEEAVKLFEQGVKADPENDQARLALAVSQLQSGSTDAGVGQLQNIIASKPDSLRANQVLILTHLQAKQFDKAIATADAMVKATPKNPEAYNLKGTVSLAVNDQVAARAAFKAALEKNEKFVPAMLNLARVEAAEKKLDDAKKWYRKVIAVEPTNQTAYTGLTNLALVEKNSDEAIKAMEQAIAASKSDPEPRLRLIEILMTTNQTGRALVAARDLANVLPDDPRSVDALGRTQIANGDLATGLGTYRRLASLLPNNAEAKRRMARALMAAAEAQAKPGGAAGHALPAVESLNAEAKAQLDSALIDAPDYVAALTDRLAIEKSTAGNDQALKLAQKLVQERPESLPRLIAAGDLANILGNNQVALANYRAVWDKAKSGQIARRMYEVMAKDKKSAEGLQLLKSWIADNPQDYDTRFLLTSVAINEGRYDDAIAETEAMKGNLPDSPVLLNNLAWLYGEKNSPRAFEFAEKALTLAPESADILDTAGWLEVEKRDAKKGVALLAKSTKLAPANPLIAYHYAVGLKKTGDSKKAAETLRELLKTKAQFKERAVAEALLKELGG